MKKAKVYFTDLTTTGDTNLLIKLQNLIEKAGIRKINFKDKFTAIKLHFGEPGNLAFLRPNFARVLIDEIKNLGGKPFVTDCNTLYVGRRKNALDHLDAAYENGFNPFSLGCHVIIGDGLKGTDETIVRINQEFVKEAKIGTAIMDADIFISLSHFKGHEAAGFGGAIKNIGMGCGSRAGKMEMHSAGKPSVIKERCVGCKQCVKNCAQDAISFTEEKKAVIDEDDCVGCGRCIGNCNYDAIQPIWSEKNDVMNKKMAEYTKAVLDDRPSFHVSLVIDVSPYCDCYSKNDLPIINDVGMFASFDPVALDKACADAANKQPLLQNSILAEKTSSDFCEKDYFHLLHPDTNWEICLEHAEKIGLGTQDYELITVK